MGNRLWSMYQSTSSKCCSNSYVCSFQYSFYKVTEKPVSKGLDYGLEILVTYTFTKLARTVTWIQKWKISEEMKTTEKMKNKYLKWNSRLFFSPFLLIRSKFYGKSSFGAEKIYLIIRKKSNGRTSFGAEKSCCSTLPHTLDDFSAFN